MNENGKDDNWSDLKKKLFALKGLAFIGSADIIGIGLTGIFWFTIATLIEVEEFGQIHYFLAIAGMAYIVAQIGTQNAITVYSAKKVNVVSTLFLFSLLAGTMSAFVVFFISNEFHISFLVLGFLVNDLSLGYLLGNKLFKNYSKYILTQKSLTILLGFGFYFILGPEGIIFALALSYIHFLILIYKGLKTSPINFSTLKPRAGFIINNYAYSTLGGLRANIDKLIIAPLLGFALLGNLVLAIQFYVILQIIPSLVFKYTLTHDASGIPTTKVKLWTMVFAIVSCIGTIVLSPYIIPGFFPKFAEVVIAIQILSVCIIPDTLANIFYTSKFLGQEKSKNPLIATVIMVILTALGIIILGPIYGILGVSFSFVLASFSNFTYLFFANRAFKMTQK
tara:strand:- start:24 stop:1205 length:1182 start_codon:yes stop_codon:yes gene_type:complete